MKKIGKILGVALTGIFVIICLHMFSKNVYAEEYPSVDDLSEEEKELLPYYDNGWRLSCVDNDPYRRNNYVANVYYLGKKVKTINSELKLDGVKYYQNFTERDKYAITDNHQLFMICHQFNGHSGDSYDAMIRYDLDTDSYKMINSISYLCNTNDCPYVTGLMTNGEDVYLLCRPYVYGYYNTKVFKYDSKQDKFVYLSTIAEYIDSNIIYDSDEKMWIAALNSNSEGRYFVKYNFENGTSVKVNNYYPDDGVLKESIFSWWQKKTGKNYYNKVTNVLNSNTGLYDSYTSLYMHDENTSTDIELIKENNANYQVGVSYHLEFVTHKGIVVIRNNDSLSALIFDDAKKTYKSTEDIGVGMFVNRKNYDMWNYYIAGEAYPIYEPVTVQEVKVADNKYADRATIIWDDVSTATGYNVYVNGKKVNTSVITDNTYTVKGLNKNTTYKITMTAVNSVGESEKSKELSVKTGTVILGDMNGDGKINIIDAMKIFHYVSGRNKNIDTSLADINGDGKVNIIDAMKIFHYVSGRNKEY